MPSIYIRKNNKKYNRRRVCQFKMNGEFVKEWKTAGDVMTKTGYDKSAILKCCKGLQKKSYRYIWKFKDDLSPEILEMVNKSQAV